MSRKSAAPHLAAKQAAADMIEAVDYLIGVAVSAGLDDVACKLGDVNTELLSTRLAANEDEPDQSPESIRH
jgi:hypothetical protein